MFISWLAVTAIYAHMFHLTLVKGESVATPGNLHEQTINFNCDCDDLVATEKIAQALSKILPQRAAPIPKAACPDEFVAVNRSCYLFRSLPTTWSDARSVCHYYGADLATIETLEENAFLHSRFYEEFVQRRQYDTSSDGHYFWVGGTDESSESYWVWAASGDPIRLNLWADQQPASSNRDQNYLCIDLWTGRWHDHLNRKPLGYVCETAKKN